MRAGGFYIQIFDSYGSIRMFRLYMLPGSGPGNDGMSYHLFMSKLRTNKR